MVVEGKFREDLLYRLEIIPIEIPALRERKKDIPLLIDFFINKFSKEMNKGLVRIEEDALDILMQYDFPGNIRELENIIERLVILALDGKVTASVLPKEVVKGAYSRKNTFVLPPDGISLEEVEEGFVRQALEMVKGNQTQAAKLLGISRHALIYIMEKFKIQ